VSAKLLPGTIPKSQWHVYQWSKLEQCCRAGALWTEPSVHPSTVHCHLPYSRSRHYDSVTSVLQLTIICLEGYTGAGWCHPSGHCGPSQLCATSQPFIWQGMPCKGQHSSPWVYKGEHLHSSCRVKLIAWLACSWRLSLDNMCRCGLLLVRSKVQQTASFLSYLSAAFHSFSQHCCTATTMLGSSYRFSF